jgi:peptidoglycan/xylan/chitin deacetylase (PgdA/CDA1 family)
LWVVGAVGLVGVGAALVILRAGPHSAGTTAPAVRGATSGGGATSTEGFDARPGCTIVGTEGDDRLVGTPGGDLICGLAGDDTIAGRSGDDVIKAGRGDDSVRGGAGDDVVSGGAGSDRLSGGAGRDSLHGGSGPDVLESRDHRPYERLDGGRGVNLCVADPSDARRGCRHPLVGSHRRAVPILVYHVIGNPPATQPLKELWVSRPVLARQMAYLDRQGYEVVSLQELYDYWHGGPLPAKAVVLSFDDGFRSDYTRVRPMLAAHGWAGTLNLVLSHYQRSWGLGRRAVKGLIRAGWELDCHTRTHAYLPGLDERSLRREVAGARRFLRRTFGVPVNFFAYPSGAYDERVIAAVRRAGFEGATTTAFGLARPGDPFTMNRIAVLRSDRIADFAAKLEG